MNENLVKSIKRGETAQNGLRKAIVISSLNKGGKYCLTEAERSQGFYFLFAGLEVPFRALFTENNKTKGILGICFVSADECPSRQLGLCQLPSDKLCYARSGEKRATRRNNEDGSQGMDSLKNACLSSYFWDLWKESEEVRNSLFDYLDYKEVHTLRFNLKGDFRDSEDIAIIWHFAQMGYNMTGYTARDDLALTLEGIANHPRIILNGSNRCYTNRFEATDNLRAFFDAKYRCLGSCSNCRKCYSLRNRHIMCLVHGNGSDTALNNENNHKFINFVFNRLGFEPFTPEEWEANKGLITCLNKAIAKQDHNFRGFKDAKDLINFFDSLDIWGDL